MISIYDWFRYEIPYRERYRLIKESGFNGVILYWGNEFGNNDYIHNPELARREGLFVENVHTS